MFLFQVQLHSASNNQVFIQQMCKEGLGVALIGSMDLTAALESNRLVELLPQWSFGTLDIWVVTSRCDVQLAKVRQAIAALQAYLRQLPGVLDEAHQGPGLLYKK